eukprot:scaffold9754_cov91-Skeletonema_marinoi.AAC.4
MMVISDASSGHLRRCSVADTTKKSLSRAKDASILPRPTVRYDMAVNRGDGGHLRCLIRSPTTL